MKAGFRAYLEGRCTPAAVATRLSRARSIEEAYGDLDDLYTSDDFAGVLADLRYSMVESRSGRPNPSRIKIGGDLYKRLAGLRNAISTYRQFLEGRDISSLSNGNERFEADDQSPPQERSTVFALERDLQAALRDRLDQLEPGLHAIDDGAERPVPSGFIDITAEDAAGAIVVIELKAGRAGREAVGQIMSYMGDVSVEEADQRVRGILIAASFDHKAKAAARLIPSLELRAYTITFNFTNVDEG